MTQVFQAHVGKFATDAEMLEQAIAPVSQPFEGVEFEASHVVTDGEMYTPAQRGEFLPRRQPLHRRNF